MTLKNNNFKSPKKTYFQKFGDHNLDDEIQVLNKNFTNYIK